MVNSCVNGMRSVKWQVWSLQGEVSPTESVGKTTTGWEEGTDFPERANVFISF